MAESPHISCMQHAVIEQKLDAEHRRLDKHGEQIDLMQDAIVRLTSISERMLDHDTRLKALEGKPAQKWENISMYVLTCIIGGVIGFLLTGVLR